MTDTSDENDKRTTQAIETLFTTLRQYTEGHVVSEADLLRQRARDYASTPVHTSGHTSGAVEAICFTLGTETYALEVRWVRSVVPMPPITRVPNTPSYFHGVVNVRGAIITVLDVRDLLGMGRMADARELIAVETGAYTFGLAVTRVTEVLDIPLQAIAPLDDVNYLRGVYLAAGARVLVMDGGELFGDARISGGGDS